MCPINSFIHSFIHSFMLVVAKYRDYHDEDDDSFIQRQISVRQCMHIKVENMLLLLLLRSLLIMHC